MFGDSNKRPIGQERHITDRVIAVMFIFGRAIWNKSKKSGAMSVLELAE